MKGNLLIGHMAVGRLVTNCFIVSDKDTKEAAVIDAGDEGERILSVINKNQLKLKYIISTHGHFDHNGAVTYLKEKTQASFLIHQDDLSLIENAKESAGQWGITIDKVVSPDQFIDEGDIISLGAVRFRVLKTPGHSPGGISLYCQDEGVVFSGDTLFYGSIGRTDFHQGSLKELTRSIKDKLYSLPGTTIVYTGHGDETTIDFEKENNPYVRG